MEKSWEQKLSEALRKDYKKYKAHVALIVARDTAYEEYRKAQEALDDSLYNPGRVGEFDLVLQNFKDAHKDIE